MKKYYYFYKLCCDECEEVYVGKTVNIYDRLRHHKSSCTNINGSEYNYKVYKCIRENGGWEQWLMYIIHEGEYTVEESKNIERKYVETYGTLNIAIPNNDRQKLKRKLYYEKNKEIFELKRKLYYEKNKDAINLKRRLKYAKKNYI